MKNALKQSLERAVLLAMLVGGNGYSTTEVRIVAGKFEPALVTVMAGETITFVNTTSGMHTVTGDPSLAKIAGDVVLPVGAEPFHSGIIPPGNHFDLTLTVPGSYRYVCLPHELHGMKGGILVKAPNEETTDSDDELSLLE